jgi:hypothetical protein
VGSAGSLLLASPPQGVSSSRSVNRVQETHSHALGMPLLVWHSSHTDLGPGDHGYVICQSEVLWAHIKSPCLHRPENWLVGQLIEL